MKAFAKFCAAAVLAGGAMLAMAAPASAQVSFGIGIGPGGYYGGGFGGGGYYNGFGGGYYGGGVPAYSCDTYSRFYDPYRCGYPAYSAYPLYSRGYVRPYYYPRGNVYGGYGYRGGYAGGYRGGYRGGYGGRGRGRR